MRLAIISDIHLGDSQSAVAFRGQDGKHISIGAKYGELLSAVRAQSGERPLDYLVLLGDIFDFSVASYADAYEVGKSFFQRLRDDEIANEIIYVPGNHDFDLWSTVEYQVNVTSRFGRGKLPRRFRMSVPGIIDDRADAIEGRFVLRGVSPRVQAREPGQRYGGLFLDDITSPPTPFNFAFPNVYLLTNAESVLLTHGQYLEPYWSVMGRWAQYLFDGALDLKSGGLIDLEEMVALNFPLSQLGCSVLGQAGPLTEIVQKLEHEIKQKDLGNVAGYLDRAGDEIRKGVKGVLRWVFPIAYRLVKKEVLRRLAQMEDTRYSTKFAEDPRVRRMLADFYASTAYEISQLKEKYGVDIPLPTSMIMGHTHQPIPWQSPRAPTIRLPQLPGDKPFSLYNTGGWLYRREADGQLSFCGAEVFFYESGKGISSKAIGYTPA